MSFAARRILERPVVAPLRSLLFVPGSFEKSVAAAAETGADGVCLDLEEPETPMTESVRARAHALVGDFLRSRRPGAAEPRYFVRVRAASTCGATMSTIVTSTPARAQYAASTPPIAPPPQTRTGAPLTSRDRANAGRDAWRPSSRRRW